MSLIVRFSLLVLPFMLLSDSLFTVTCALPQERALTCDCHQERMTFGGATKSLEAAKKAFESKFKDKTSFAWDQGKGLDQGRGRQGKYSPITVASSEEGDGKWQYYQDNHMDGKAPGWYDYFAEAVPTVEVRTKRILLPPPPL